MEEFETYLDTQDIAVIDSIHSIFEISVKKMSAAIFKELMSRNFDLTHSIFKAAINEIVKPESVQQVDPRIYDNMFSILGFLPMIYAVQKSIANNMERRYFIFYLLFMYKSKRYFFGESRI